MTDANALIQSIKYKRFGLKPEDLVHFTESPTHLILRNDYTTDEFNRISQTLLSHNIDFYFTEVASSAEVQTEEQSERVFFGVLGPKVAKTLSKRDENGAPQVIISEEKHPALRIRLPKGMKTEDVIALLDKAQLSSPDIASTFTRYTEQANERYKGVKGQAMRQLESDPDHTAAALYAGGDIIHTFGVGGANAIKMHEGAGAGDIAFGALAGVGTLGFFDAAAQRTFYSPTELYNLQMAERLSATNSAFAKALNLPTPHIKPLPEAARFAWNKTSGTIGEITNALSGAGLVKSALDQNNLLTAVQGGLVLSSWTGATTLPHLTKNITPGVASFFEKLKTRVGAPQEGEEPSRLYKLVQGAENLTATILKDPRQLIKLNLVHNLIGISQVVFELFRVPMARNHIEKQFNPETHPELLGINLQRQPDGGFEIIRGGDWRKASYEQNALLLCGLKTGYIGVDTNTGTPRALSEEELKAVYTQAKEGDHRFTLQSKSGPLQVLAVEPRISAEKFDTFFHGVADHQKYGRQKLAGALRTLGYSVYLGANYTYSEANNMRTSAIDLYEVYNFGAKTLLLEQARRDSDPALRNDPERASQMARLFDAIVKDIQSHYVFKPLQEGEIRDQLLSALKSLEKIQNFADFADQNLGELSKKISKLTSLETPAAPAAEQTSDLINIVRDQSYYRADPKPAL